MAQDKDRGRILTAWGLATTVGINMVATVAVGLICGRLADNWLGSSPWCTVAGIVLGMIAGLWAVYKRITDI